MNRKNYSFFTVNSGKVHGFRVELQGYRGPMARSGLKTLPKPGEVWLSCPPYLMMARIVDVDLANEPPVVSYELHDDDGSLLQAVEHATLDFGWWRTFQRLEPRFG
jgi:hypothetical protein